MSNKMYLYRDISLDTTTTPFCSLLIRNPVQKIKNQNLVRRTLIKMSILFILKYSVFSGYND